MHALKIHVGEKSISLTDSESESKNTVKTKSTFSDNILQIQNVENIIEVAENTVNTTGDILFIIHKLPFLKLSIHYLLFKSL